MTDQNPELLSPLIENGNQNPSQEAALFAVDTEARTVRGLLIPWGEESRPNASGNEPLTFEAGSIRVPEDLAPLSVNVGHDRFSPVANFAEVEDTDQGLVATFRVAKGEDGDKLLSDISTGLFKKLSAELRHIVREGKRGISAVLTGGAFVTEGAFASAGLFSVAPDEEEDERHVSPEELIEHAAALIAEAKAQLTKTPESDKDPETDSSVNPAEDTETKETEMENTEAVVPATSMLASSAAPAQPGANELFELIDNARKGNETALLALSDIKYTGAGALPATGVLQPAWAGHLWQGRAYQRKYMPLIRNGVIRALEEKGFVLDQGTALVQPWGGNKAAVPSGTASTSLKSSEFQKWAYAADIAREFFDLPGGAEVIEAFLRGVNESYARVTDEWTLTKIVAAATNVVAPDTYPADYPDVFGLLIQGAEVIEDAGDTASFAILNQKAWDEFKYTPKDALPEFLSFTFGIGRDATGAQIPRIVKGDIGIEDTAAVLVGSAAAAHVNERAGESPIVENALDIANGGVDRLVVGYTQFMAERPDSLVIVGEEDE